MQGHIVGDTLLSVVAERLRQLAGEDAVVGRLMGDEFVVLLIGETGAAALEERLRALHRDLRGSYAVSALRSSSP